MASTSDALVRIRVSDGAASGAMRSSASRNSGGSLASGRSCVGRFAVLTGQNREPTPPARITHQTPVVLAGRWSLVAASITRIRLVVHPRPRLVVNARQFCGAMEETLGTERLRHEVRRA